MDRILYSQHENVASSFDYFVIDGVHIQQRSHKTQEAFRLITEAENWKKSNTIGNLTVNHKDGFFLLKSHFDEKDDLGRALFVVYLIRTDTLENALYQLKADAKKINKTISTNTNILSNLENNEKSNKIAIISVALLFIIITILWKIL